MKGFLQLFQDLNNKITEYKGDTEDTHYETTVRDEQNDKVDILHELENGISGGSNPGSGSNTNGRQYSRTETELIKQKSYWQGRKDKEVATSKEREWGWYKSAINRDIQLLGESGRQISPLFGEFEGGQSPDAGAGNETGYNTEDVNRFVDRFNNRISDLEIELRCYRQVEDMNYLFI